ncbi:hypothetical protein DFS34DRAFT_435185 [Phlyctochytrium arcticum]|nr:hypothetical protein DFS34DRAFT_435185 [Phlyctochytrium arcticum]
MATLKTLALLAAAAATTVSADTTNGAWKVVNPNAGVVPIHVAYMPGDKMYMSERVHILPLTTNGVSPEDIATRAATPYYNHNPNLANSTFLTDAAEFDFNANTFTMIDHIPPTEDQGKNQGYAFCSGHAQLADGTYIIVGGDQFWYSPFKNANWTSDGRRDIRIYAGPTNYKKVGTIFNDRNIQPNGNQELWGRWYPSVVSLPDEKNVLILGGQRAFYNPDNTTWDYPTYEIFNLDSKTSSAPVELNLLKKAFPVNMYPVAYVLPKSGDVWYFANNDSAIINVATNKETPSVPIPATPELLGRSFPFAGTNFVPMTSYRTQYEMTSWLCGGVNPLDAKGAAIPREGNSQNWYANCPNCGPSPICHHLPLEKPDAQWTREDMPLGRSQPAAVNLPDGTVVIVSGSGKGHQGGVFGQSVASEGVKQAVIFDPSKKVGDAARWKKVATATIERHYHNTALLREDGTVVTGGGDAQNFGNPAGRPDEMGLEVYSPPYLFIPNRPEIAAAPTQIKHAQKFVITLKSDVGASIKQVSIIRYASMTHTMNLDQRHIELEILKYGKNKLYVQAPPNANVAQSGNWMLWAVDDRGAPVVKAWAVSLRSTNPGTDEAWSEADTIATPAFAGSSSDATTSVIASSLAAVFAAAGAAAALL